MPASDAPAIGVLRHFFLPPSETFIYESIRSLTRYSAKVFAIAQRSPDKFPWPDVTALRSLPLGSLEALLYRVTTYSPRLFAWARRTRLLHAHLGQTGVHGLAAARRCRIPLVTSFYGRDVTVLSSSSRFSPSYWHFWAMARLLFNRGDRFLVLSEDMRTRLVNCGCPEDKIRVVPLGIDTARFAAREPRTQQSGRPVRVLMVGREVEKKGFDDGLRACALAKSRGADIAVTILGTGDVLKTPLQRQAHELALDVEWPAPSSSVVDTMHAADILLVPSKTAANGDAEGTPTVVCEGASASLPIVATRHAGIPYQIEDGVTGLLAAERDANGLADAVVQLAKNHALRVDMGARGAKKMQAEYSVAAHRDRVQTVYDELLEGTR